MQKMNIMFLIKSICKIDKSNEKYLFQQFNYKKNENMLYFVNILIFISALQVINKF